LDEAQQGQVAEGLAAFWRYMEVLVASRQPQDDFTSDLVHTRDASGWCVQPSGPCRIVP